MTAGVTIRAATVADVESVLPMVARVVALHEEWDAARYRALGDVVERYRLWLPERARDARSVFLVASAAGGAGERVVGFLVAGVEGNIPIYEVVEFGFIHDMWVEPEWRCRGVAGALVREAVARFGGMGVKQVRLETAAGNEGARRVFAEAGFRVTAVEMAVEVDPNTLRTGR